MGEGRTISRGFDAFPIISWTFFLNELGKVFHTEDEDVRGEGILLPNATGRLERLQSVTIEKN